jgi:hypothetical protein
MLIGACGLVCSDCEAYKATQANDAEWRERIAKQWSEQYKIEFKPEQILCDGCLAGTERIIGHAAECGIRPCVLARGLRNCAGCEEYACETLTGFFKMAPDAKKTLDGLREKGI